MENKKILPVLKNVMLNMDKKSNPHIFDHASPIVCLTKTCLLHVTNAESLSKVACPDLSLLFGSMCVVVCDFWTSTIGNPSKFVCAVISNFIFPLTHPILPEGSVRAFNSFIPSHTHHRRGVFRNFDSFTAHGTLRMETGHSFKFS